MKLVFVVCLALAALCVGIKADSLNVGAQTGAVLAYLENVKLGSLPFTTRTKNVFYSSPTNKIIRAITAYDLNNSKGKATITAGGVGSTFVNIKMKSERGEGLNYQVQIYE